MKTNLCLYCHLELVGRFGKRFCDNTCRSSYHNRIYRLQKDNTRTIDKMLKRNRLILEYSYEKGAKIVDRQTLEYSGFNFDYFTHHFESMEGIQFCFCYDFGYAPILMEEGKYKIIRKKRYK